MAAYALTEREEQVTRQVLQGASTAQIAEALCISPHTVQQHLKNIFEKDLGRSRRQLVNRIPTTPGVVLQRPGQLAISADPRPRPSGSRFAEGISCRSSLFRRDRRGDL